MVMVMVRVRVRVRRLPGGGGDRIVSVSAWPISSGGRVVRLGLGIRVREGSLARAIGSGLG